MQVHGLQPFTLTGLISEHLSRKIRNTDILFRWNQNWSSLSPSPTICFRDGCSFWRRWWELFVRSLRRRKDANANIRLSQDRKRPWDWLNYGTCYCHFGASSHRKRTKYYINDSKNQVLITEFSRWSRQRKKARLNPRDGSFGQWINCLLILWMFSFDSLIRLEFCDVR